MWVNYLSVGQCGLFPDSELFSIIAKHELQMHLIT